MSSLIDFDLSPDSIGQWWRSTPTGGGELTPRARSLGRLFGRPRQGGHRRSAKCSGDQACCERLRRARKKSRISSLATMVG